MKENVPITNPEWMGDPSWMSKTGGYAKDMTLRDHYAGLVMQGDPIGGVHRDKFDVVAKLAYMRADAMLKAREAK